MITQMLRPKEVHDKFFKDNDQASHVEYPPDGILYRYGGHDGGAASHLRVLGLAADTAACGQFRIKYPLMVLASHGASVCARVVLPEAPLTAQEVLDVDVLLVQRQADPELLRLAKSLSQIAGVALVYDLDDYLHGVSEKSPAYVTYNPNTPLGRKILSGLTRFLRESDGCLFSTRELQALYRKDAPYSHVLTNGLDITLGERDWDLSKPRFDWRTLAESQGCSVDGDSLLWGFSGGSTHTSDLLTLGDSVARILDKAPNTFFGIQTNPMIAMNLCHDLWRLPLDRVVCLPATQFKDYPRSLSAFDVSLAPLEHSPFNYSKSSLRLMEFGAWGVPYVASKVAPFHRFHQESGGQGGHLVSRGGSFVDPMVRLLTNSDERQSRGVFLQEHVRREYDIRKTMRYLGYSLECMVARKHGRIRLPSRLAVEDSVKGLPIMNFPVGPKDPCPCGSGKAYKRCQCEPAFGRL